MRFVRFSQHPNLLLTSCFSSQLIQNASHNKINKVVDLSGTVIKTRRGRQDNSAGLRYPNAVFQMDQG